METLDVCGKALFVASVFVRTIFDCILAQFLKFQSVLKDGGMIDYPILKAHSFTFL